MTGGPGERSTLERVAWWVGFSALLVTGVFVFTDSDDRPILVALFLISGAGLGVADVTRWRRHRRARTAKIDEGESRQ